MKSKSESEKECALHCWHGVAFKTYKHGKYIEPVVDVTYEGRMISLLRCCWCGRTFNFQN